VDTNVGGTVLAVDEAYQGLFRVNEATGCVTRLDNPNFTFAPTDVDVYTASNTPPLLASGTNLSISKTAPATVNTGAAFSYTLSVTNNGPATANTVTVTDPLPAGVTFVSATGTGWTCTQSTNGTVTTVTCTTASIASGTTAPAITINVIAPSQPG